MTTARIPFKGLPANLQLPPTIRRGLSGGFATFKGRQLGQPALASNASYGFGVDMDGATPNLISLGIAERDQAAGTSNGNAEIITWTQWTSEYASSTLAGDGLTDTDYAVVAWNAGIGVVGKQSNTGPGANNRSIVGIHFGLDHESTQTPLIWYGPVAWCVARAVHCADNETAGSLAYAVDASATTDLGTATDPLIIPRAKRHGHITSIDIVPSADLAATGNTNYRIVTIYKIDTTTNTVGPVVGTLDLRTQALNKRKPTLFTLSATSTDLDLLETDILGYASLHTSSGAVIPQSAIRINMRAL